MSEEQAESAFEAIRFAKTGGEPSCVWCDCEVAYLITRKVTNRKTGEVRQRRLFKCKKCLKQFSITSGTAFHARKLSFKKIMLATLLFANGVLGKAALQIRRDIRCNHKSAWTLGHRLREPMTHYCTSRRLSGEIEMDSAVIGGIVRPANEKAHRKKQPRRHHHKATFVSVLRERGVGGRVVPYLGNEAELVEAITSLVEPESTLFTDEHPAFNHLRGRFPHRQVKHGERYSDGEGTSTNLAESAFSRFKHLYRGTYRHFSGQFAHVYHGESSWREEHRRLPNGDQFLLLLAGALHHPPSKKMRGYYQRTRQKAA